MAPETFSSPPDHSVSLAAVFRGNAGTVELEKFPTPVPSGQEILVRVEACSLCGSDLHSFHGQRKVPVPTVLGHEIVGRICAFGPQALRKDASGRELTEGTRIIWGLVASCGECFFCRRGLTQKCVRATKYGHEAFTDGYELLGGLAEHCLLVPGTTIVRVPDSLSLEAVTPCGCATATIAAALESVETLVDRTVLITGAGLLGLTAAAMARSLGAVEVIVSDINTARLTRVARFGATRTVSPNDIETIVKSVTGGHGVDVAVEVSGANQAFDSLWPHVRLGGTVALVGAVFPSDAISLSMERIVRRNLTIRGIHNYGAAHLVRAIRFLSDHATTYHLDSVVSKWFPLTEVANAFCAAKDPEHIRIGIRP
jgi:alcohol dehydrogenase